MRAKASEYLAPFYFCVDVGVYTGICTGSVKDFLQGIKRVEAKSLSYHIERGDFQKWALDILEDKTLARAIEEAKRQKLQGQALRTHLYRLVSKWHGKSITQST